MPLSTKTSPVVPWLRDIVVVESVPFGDCSTVATLVVFEHVQPGSDAGRELFAAIMRRSLHWALAADHLQGPLLSAAKYARAPLFGGLTGKHRDVAVVAAAGRRATIRSHALTTAAIDQLRAAFL